jgi:tripartite-type tricarboxylate transporter receptor subunit TctC
MMNFSNLNRRSVLGVMSVISIPAWAQSATWPDKPIKFILSHPAGSGPDNVARLLGERLAKLWGQPIVIENKPGGQNVIGAQAAAKSAPDGYNFYFSTVASLVSNTYLFKALPYDPRRDFVPVAFVANSPFAILVNANSPIKTMEELIAKSKSTPGKVTLANEGPRTLGGMIARLINARAKMEANLVPFASVGVATQDLLGGHVDALVADLASTAALAKQGRLRVLAVTNAKRAAGWETVPALAELVPNFEMSGWFALMAPVGTPDAIVARVNRDMSTVLAEADIANRIAAIGPIAVSGMNPAAVAEFFKGEHARWAQMSKEIGLLPE